MKIVVTGGKGGTGKSTVATALAIGLAKENKVMLVDCDVDCPNDHILLSIKRKKERDVFQTIPEFDFDKCMKCGKCSEVCKSNAIVFVKGKHPIFNDCPCNGCKACIISCPSKAIKAGKKKAGEIYSGKMNNLKLISAQIIPNYAMSALLVKKEREYAKKSWQKGDFVVIDTSAGTHCNVVEAVMDVDLALVVTEPTPLGEHDLGVILKLLKKLGIPAKVILNKSDLGDKKLIQKIVKKYRIKIIAEIPYDKRILEAYYQGRPIENINIKNILKHFKK
ncbi:MAG: ATP-binding protein [Nanoarchaeota archaeon]|nr:ATP-binding protein [Nanoarchaeota archaeon]